MVSRTHARAYAGKRVEVGGWDEEDAKVAKQRQTSFASVIITRNTSVLGLTNSLNLKTRIVINYFGHNVASKRLLKVVLVQKSDQSSSIA